MTARVVSPTRGEDDGLVDALRQTWMRTDPVPAGLVDRVLFAIGLEGLDAELAVLVDSSLVGARAAARPEEAARTITFSSTSLTATITISDSPGGGSRVDGWLAPAEAIRVEVRRTDQAAMDVLADDGGRFVIDGLPRGLVQLVFHPVPGAGGALSTVVAVPPVRL